MIRAYVYQDPDEQPPEARAFRLARLELAERLAGEEGVPHARMRSADGGLYLLLEADGPEGRRAFSGLVLALDGYGATQSLLLEFESRGELSYLRSLPGAACDNFKGAQGSLVPPLEPVGQSRFGGVGPLAAARASSGEAAAGHRRTAAATQGP
ncbi:hypothetical protein [Rubrobacter marinus]|uniref:hypothetical protein n=1 Tax=Rubrobacter marinus TaxID=2653852 RepID=UPI00140960D9|nr:hypothetical protein [Rubrobacter marinus]